MSSSSELAVTIRLDTPGAETWKTASSSSMLPSAGAVSVTACHAFQFSGPNVRSAPL